MIERIESFNVSVFVGTEDEFRKAMRNQSHEVQMAFQEELERSKARDKREGWDGDRRVVMISERGIGRRHVVAYHGRKNDTVIERMRENGVEFKDWTQR